MTEYWMRHRLLYTLLLSVTIAGMTVLLFVFPYVGQHANAYNSQSIYRNTDIDFIAPEPSFEQTTEFAGTHGIDKVFPFYMTKTQVNINGISRTTTVLLSDQFQNVDITMYNEKRLIEKSSTVYDKPIWVDWQFCHDTAAKIGDTISFTLNGATVEYTIYAICETNTIYDGGAILAQISSEQKEAISQNSKNNGYSGIFISASDYADCQAYLATEYRPLGRLKSPGQFESEEQYQIHYDAIMNSAYANEITDFRVRESGLDKQSSDVMIWIGAALTAAIVLIFNIVMSKRGCEKIFFTKHCVPKGRSVKPYYVISFWLELVTIVGLYAVALILRINYSDEFIPVSALDWRIAAIPVTVVISEIISLIANRSMIADIAEKKKPKFDK